MTDSMKVGIRENIELIDDGNFDEFYKQVSSFASNGYQDIGDVTTFLIEKCGITPKVSYIPKGYMFKNQSIKDVNIDEGVRGIGMAAYLGSSIHEITLPKSCEAVEAQAFSGCTNLVEIQIKNPDIVIDCSAFTYAGCIYWIKYWGSMEQFKSKEWPDELIEDSCVICLDGIVYMVNGVAKK